jgi:hypothetical protein
VAAPKHERQGVFLAALGRGLSVKDAAADAGLHPRTCYKWKRADRDFARAWAEAGADRIKALETEAMRRALSGTQKPVYRGGELVGHVTEYSDAMLMFLLKRHSERAGAQASIEDQVKGARETLLGKFTQADEGGAPRRLSEQPDGA